jgi:hypothetical protein
MQHPIDYERITIPPHGGTRIVCLNWPDCGCGDDCTDLARAESPRVVLCLFALMIAVAAIGAGLLIAGFR